MKGELLKVQQITQRIMFHYSRLYHQVEKKGSKQPDSSIENRLRETQYALKAKKE